VIGAPFSLLFGFWSFSLEGWYACAAALRVTRLTARALVVVSEITHRRERRFSRGSRATPADAVFFSFLRGAAPRGPYFIRHVPSLTALERETGRIVWRWVPPESPAFQSGFAAGPVIEEKTLVIGALDGTLYAFPIDKT